VILAEESRRQIRRKDLAKKGSKMVRRITRCARTSLWCFVSFWRQKRKFSALSESDHRDAIRLGTAISSYWAETHFKVVSHCTSFLRTDPQFAHAGEFLDATQKNLHFNNLSITLPAT